MSKVEVSERTVDKEREGGREKWSDRPGWTGPGQLDPGNGSAACWSGGSQGRARPFTHSLALPVGLHRRRANASSVSRSPASPSPSHARALCITIGCFNLLQTITCIIQIIYITKLVFHFTHFIWTQFL